MAEFVTHRTLVRVGGMESIRMSEGNIYVMQTYPHMTTPWVRCHMRHFQFSGDPIRSLKRIIKSFWHRWRYIIWRLRFNDSWNHLFNRHLSLIPLMEVFGRVSPAWLSQFVKLHLHLPKTLHAILYRFGDCAHHPPWCVILAKLALQDLVHHHRLLPHPPHGRNLQHSSDSFR